MAGKGSIEKRGENTWRLVVSAGMRDKQQIKKKKTVTTDTNCPEKSCSDCKKITRCKARREAERLLAEFTVEVEKGTFIEPTKLTFRDFTDRWLRDYAEKNLAPKTLFRYKQILESRIFPAMGHLKVEKITPVHLMKFYANLQEDGVREDGKKGGLSEKTILQHHRIISSILQDAVQWQVIPANPASRVKPPKVKKKAAAFYDEEQTAALLMALENEPMQYRVIIILAIATGLRRGELMGLQWQDVDFKENSITVRQAAQYVPGKGSFFKEPKNETSKRTISVPASVMALLKQYKAHQAAQQLKVGDLWQESEMLFTTWDGRPMHPDTISKWFPKFLARTIIHKPCGQVVGDKPHCPHCKKPIKEKDVLNLPPLPFHGLRHTAATLLIGQGAPLKNVSARLGHADISTTGNIYAHALKSVDKDIADKMDHVFNIHIEEQSN